MTSFIQEVIGLITKRRTVKSLDSINDYFLLGRKRDPGLLQSSYNPKMDPYAVKVQDLMCSILQGSGTSSPNYIPVFKLPAPGSTCSVGSLANSVIYQDPATSALKFEGYGQGNFVGSVSRLLAVDTDGNIIETTASGGGGTGPLQDVTDLGNTTTNSIDIVGNDLNLDFTQYVRWSGNVGITRNNINDMELNAGSVLTIVADGAVAMPIGLSADRPVGVDGMLRFNTDIDEFEGYKNGAWYTLPDGNTTNTTLEILLGTTTLRLTDSDGNFVQTDLSGLVAGVTTVNGLTGDIVLTPGTNITFNTVGNEITINATDTDTTYSLLLSGTDIQLVGSDGSVDTVPLNPINTTNVSLDFDPVDTSLLVLTDSDGNTVDVDLAAFEPITYTLSTLAPTSPIITLNGSDGSTSSINYAWDGYSYTLAYILTDPANPTLRLNNGFGPVLPDINLRRLLDIRTDAGTGDVHIQLKNADGTLISESPGISVGGGGGPVPIIDSLVLTTPDSTPADPNWTLTLTDTQANSVSESMLPLLQSDSYELTAHPTGTPGTPAGPTEIRLTNLYDTGLVDSITLETINYDYNLQFIAPSTLRFTETNKLGVDTDIDVDLSSIIGYDTYDLTTDASQDSLSLVNTVTGTPDLLELQNVNYDYTLLWDSLSNNLTLRETRKDDSTSDVVVNFNGLVPSTGLEINYFAGGAPSQRKLDLLKTNVTPNNLIDDVNIHFMNLQWVTENGNTTDQDVYFNGSIIKLPHGASLPGTNIQGQFYYNTAKDAPTPGGFFATIQPVVHNGSEWNPVAVFDNNEPTPGNYESSLLFPLEEAVITLEDNAGGHNLRIESHPNGVLDNVFIQPAATNSGRIVLAGKTAVEKAGGTAVLPTYTLEVRGDGAVLLPKGDDASRPTPTEGLIRYNNEQNYFEGYYADTVNNWVPFGTGVTPTLQEVLEAESNPGDVATLITIRNTSPLGSETDIEFGFTNTLNIDSAIVLRGYESGRRDVSTADRVLVIQEDTEGNPDVRTMQGLATVEVITATESATPGVYDVIVSNTAIAGSGLVVTPMIVGESDVYVAAVISFSGTTGTVKIKALDGTNYTGSTIDLNVSYQTL